MPSEKKFDPRVLVEHIDTFGKNLNEWEIKFIADLVDHPERQITPKMEEIINRIYDEKC
jgi:hypothetical protein